MSFLQKNWVFMAKVAGGIACLALAVVMVVANIGSLWEGPGISHPSGLGVSKAVGVFLIPFILLIVALNLFQKPKR